jgi:hypothetical protein
MWKLLSRTQAAAVAQEEARVVITTSMVGVARVVQVAMPAAQAVILTMRLRIPIIVEIITQ